MIWLNMASTLSGWCWLGVRLCDWTDIMEVEMGHVEGREGKRMWRQDNDLSGRYIN